MIAQIPAFVQLLEQSYPTHTDVDLVVLSWKTEKPVLASVLAQIPVIVWPLANVYLLKQNVSNYLRNQALPYSSDK